MKIILILIVLINVITLANAQNKVVVIPLIESPAIVDIAPAKVINVAKSGGDFTDIGAALDSITDSSINKPYLVLIGPGVYNVTAPLDVKWGVSVIGSGVDNTEIIGMMSSFPAVQNPLINGPTVFYARNSTTFSNFTLNVVGQSGSILSKAIQLSGDTRHPAAPGSGVKINTVNINVGGSNTNYGIDRLSNSRSIGDLSLSNVNIKVLPGDLSTTRGSYGILSSSPYKVLNIDNSSIEVYCDDLTECQGIRASFEPQLRLSNSTIIADTSSTTRGLNNASIIVDFGVKSFIQSSTITGSIVSYGSLCDIEGCVSITKIYNSTLFQNVDGDNISCFNSNNGTSILSSRCTAL